MKLSLRAIGLYSLLQKPKYMAEIIELTTDMETAVIGAFNELVKNKRGVLLNDMYYATEEHGSMELKERFHKLFVMTRTYAIILWWYEELIETLGYNIDFGDDHNMREMVEREYATARELSYKTTDQDLYESFKTMAKNMDKDEKTIPRLSGLFDYSKRIDR